MSDKLEGSKKKEKVKELLNRHFTTEVLPAMNQRLDEIEKFCQENLRKQDERSKAVQGFLVNDVLNGIKNHVHNTHITMEAFMEVIADHVKIEDFDKKIDERKLFISERLKKQREAEMAAKMGVDTNKEVEENAEAK